MYHSDHLSVLMDVYAVSHHEPDPYQTLQWKTVSKGRIFFFPTMASLDFIHKIKSTESNMSHVRHLLDIDGSAGISLPKQHLCGHRPALQHKNHYHIHITGRWHPSILS